jgi:hypothetical protein
MLLLVLVILCVVVNLELVIIVIFIDKTLTHTLLGVTWCRLEKFTSPKVNGVQGSHPL